MRKAELQKLLAERARLEHENESLKEEMILCRQQRDNWRAQLEHENEELKSSAESARHARDVYRKIAQRERERRHKPTNSSVSFLSARQELFRSRIAQAAAVIYAGKRKPLFGEDKRMEESLEEARQILYDCGMRMPE